MAMQTTSNWGALLPPGLGDDKQATQATAAMRQAPWYQQWLQSKGLTGEGDQYGNVKLDESQRAELMALALKNGIGLNHKYDMIDENGQIAEEHHKLKKVAIAAAIAGLAVTGLGAAGIGPLAGALGGATAAGTGAGAVGADVAGATALGGGGVLAGLPGAMATLPAIGGAAGTAAGAGGTLAKMASLLKPGAKGSTSALSDIIDAAGKGIGDAETAAGNNRLDQEKLGLEYGAAIDAQQRKTALQNIARQSTIENPRVSPFDTVGAPKYSDQYKSTVSQLANMGQGRLAKPDDVITPSTVQVGTNTAPGTLSKIGQYIGPATTIASKIPWSSLF